MQFEFQSGWVNVCVCVCVCVCVREREREHRNIHKESERESERNTSHEVNLKHNRHLLTHLTYAEIKNT